MLAGEPWAMADLLDPLDASLSADLRGIQCPPVTVAALGYSPAAASRIPVGFGVLIARGEGYRMLGNLWETNIFPERGPDGHLLVRAMFGGAIDPGVAALDDEASIELARAEVARLYGITEPPAFTHAVRWPRAIPQYEIGHLDRVTRIERAVSELPGLTITGAGLRGVAFADAAADGTRTGESAALFARRRYTGLDIRSA